MFSACNDAEYDKLPVHAFIGESLTSSGTTLTIEEGGSDTQISVRLSEQAPSDAEFELQMDPTVLDRYNEVQSSSFVALPLTNSDGSTNYEMDNKVIVKAGQFSAPATQIHIKELSAELSKTGESYALPLRLVSKDGKIPAMDQTACYVITLEGIFEFTAPQLQGGTNVLRAEMPNGTEQYGEWTVEIRFQISDTGNRNRFVFSSGSTGDGGVFMRFEDPNPGAEDAENPLHSWIQMDTGLGWANAKVPFKTNVWQHVAMTSNGTQMSLYVNGKLAVVGDFARAQTSFLGMNWFDADTWWNGCKILVAEGRVWSTCRTETQIANNITSVSPRSKNLVAYWKFNEGTGNTVADFSGNGHTLNITGSDVKWISGIKSTDTATPWAE